jgi:flagellin
MGTNERAAIQSEMKQLLTAIDAIGGRTKFSGNSLLNNDARTNGGTATPPTTTKFTLQSSNQTSDTIALTANAFLNIGGFSSVAQSFTTTGTGTSGQSTIAVASASNLAIGMKVTGSGTGLAGDIRITDIVGTTITLSSANTGTVASQTFTFSGGTTDTAATRTMTLATGSAPPQTIVGTTVYKITGTTYASIGSVTSVNGDVVTLGATSGGAVPWLDSDKIVFSGQLTQKHSTTSGDLSLSQSVGADLTTAAGATAAFQMVQRAADGYLTALTTQRSLLGAYQNQIEYTVSNVTELSANLDAARSNVQDTDYASETATLTKGQILQQAATAMLAQANQMPNVILSLLK